LGVEGPLRLVGAVALLERRLAFTYRRWQSTFEHVVWTLATLHVGFVAVLVENSIPDIDSRGACALFPDAIRSETAKGRCVCPRICCELVTVRGALEPKRIVIELARD